MKYDFKTENIDYVDGIITDDRLKGLDKELAAYPFEGLGLWRSLVSRVTEDLLDKVMGERKEGRLDGMTSIKGMEEEDVRLNSRGKSDAEGKLIFPVVYAKRSWRDGAVGGEVTKYSKDKSWLLGDVVKNEGGECYHGCRRVPLTNRSHGSARIPTTRICPPTSPIFLLEFYHVSTTPHPLYSLTLPTRRSTEVHSRCHAEYDTQSLHLPSSYIISPAGCPT